MKNFDEAPKRLLTEQTYSSPWDQGPGLRCPGDLVPGIPSKLAGSKKRESPLVSHPTVLGGVSGRSFSTRATEVVTIIFSYLLTLPLRRSRFDLLVVSLPCIGCTEDRHLDIVLVFILLSSLKNGDKATYVWLRQTTPPPLGFQS